MVKSIRACNIDHLCGQLVAVAALVGCAEAGCAEAGWAWSQRAAGDQRVVAWRGACGLGRVVGVRGSCVCGGEIS